QKEIQGPRRIQSCRPNEIAVFRSLPFCDKLGRMGVLQVESRDGTRIAAHIGGHGPPLLAVHGATADHSTTWRLVGPMFEDRFTLYRMDRRGRGESGDSDDYSIEREFEDVAAVVDAIGEPTFVIGHSYGAEITLGALPSTPNIKKFVHYEGGIPAIFPTPIETIDRIQALIDDGDREAAVIVLFQELLGMDPETFRQTSGEQAWAARIRNVHTLPRELRAENDYDITQITDELSKIKIPVLLLIGGESSPALVEPSERLATILPNTRTEAIPGETHAAMLGSPNAFVEVVTRFLDEPGVSAAPGEKSAPDSASSRGNSGT
ncbi:MAG: alpha/beta hydrolase, partial [Actinomycetota bacterium]|nr:alpha/beta hydrolase [Actinomycetota bacterium]